jgi:adenosylcobinamide amidohydrolase
MPMPLQPPVETPAILPELPELADCRPEVEQTSRWLVATFPRPMQLLSWAVVAGGATLGRQVAWYQVGDHELRPPVDAAGFLQDKLQERGLAGAVGLLTSADLRLMSVVTRRFGDEQGGAVATVGMGNALRIGDEPSVSGRIGTINILCWTSAPLTRTAQLEALSLTTEARTAAVIDAGIQSRRSRAVATGTGTDCIVLASPHAAAGKQYAGKHTTVGHLIGAAAYEAVAQGLEAWQRARRAAGGARCTGVGLGG